MALSSLTGADCSDSTRQPSRFCRRPSTCLAPLALHTTTYGMVKATGCEHRAGQETRRPANKQRVRLLVRPQCVARPPHQKTTSRSCGQLQGGRRRGGQGVELKCMGCSRLSKAALRMTHFPWSPEGHPTSVQHTPVDLVQYVGKTERTHARSHLNHVRQVALDGQTAEPRGGADAVIAAAVAPPCRRRPHAPDLRHCHILERCKRVVL